MSSVFAVCDIETDYAVRFMEFLNQRALPFEVQMFTSVPPLCEYGKKKHIELLLISERAMCEEVRSLKVGKLILLSEGADSTADELPSVYKYQSSAQVVREVLDCYSAEQIAAQTSQETRNRHGKMIGIYGMFDPVRQMLFSLTLGQILAETRRVLYINLQKYTGLMDLTGDETEGTLSDLLYFYRQGKKGLFYRLPGMIRQIGRLEYIPAPSFSEDLGELTGEEWVGFLEEIRNLSGHDVLLLDLSDSVRGLTGILELCAERLFLSGEDAFSIERRRLLEKELDQKETDPFRWLSPPEAVGIRQDRWFLESLGTTCIGEYIKKYVTGPGK